MNTAIKNVIRRLEVVTNEAAEAQTIIELCTHYEAAAIMRGLDKDKAARALALARGAATNHEAHTAALAALRLFEKLLGVDIGNNALQYARSNRERVIAAAEKANEQLTTILKRAIGKYVAPLGLNLKVDTLSPRPRAFDAKLNFVYDQATADAVIADFNAHGAGSLLSEVAPWLKCSAATSGAIDHASALKNLAVVLKGLRDDIMSGAKTGRPAQAQQAPPPPPPPTANQTAAGRKPRTRTASNGGANAANVRMNFASPFRYGTKMDLILRNLVAKCGNMRYCEVTVDDAIGTVAAIDKRRILSTIAVKGGNNFRLVMKRGMVRFDLL